MRVCIAGGGRAAWSVGRMALRAGWEVAGVVLRSTSSSIVPERLGATRISFPEIPPCELLFLAVSDDALDELAGRIAAEAPSARHLVHVSGSRSSEVFAPHALRGSLHPLAALPTPESEPDFHDVLFVAEGSPRTVDVLSPAVAAVGGRLSRIEASAKPLYHAAAVIGSNYVALLAELCRQLMETAGVEELSRTEIAALARTAVAGWEARGLAGITGPVSRGDVGTIERNLGALENRPAELELYRALGARLAGMLATTDQTAIYQEIAQILARARSR